MESYTFRGTHILTIGDSGSHIYGSGGKSYPSIVVYLIELAGYANLLDLTEVGADPRRGIEVLIDWANRHLQFALPQLGKSGGPPRFRVLFFVIVLDARNGLQQHDHRYTGLNYASPAGKSVYVEYGQLMDALSQFSQVVNGYSDCAERFQMGPKLDEESRALAAMARYYGMIPYSLSHF